MNYGRELMQRGQFEEAEVRFREAVRLAPQYSFARVNLGIVLAERGDILAARNEYDEAIRIEPNDPLGYYWHGLFLSRQGDTAGAITDLESSVALATVPTNELEALANNLLRAGRVDEAREAIERGFRLDPDRFRELRATVSRPPG